MESGHHCLYYNVLIMHLSILIFKALNALLGDTRADQEQKMLERLKRKKALMKARQEQGLSTEDAVLEAILDQQDEEEGKAGKKKRVRSSLFV